MLRGRREKVVRGRASKASVNLRRGIREVDERTDETKDSVAAERKECSNDTAVGLLPEKRRARDSSGRLVTRLISEM